MITDCTLSKIIFSEILFHSFELFKFGTAKKNQNDKKNNSTGACNRFYYIGDKGKGRNVDSGVAGEIQYCRNAKYGF